MTEIASSRAMPVAVRPADTAVAVWGRAFLGLIVVCWCASLVIGFQPAVAALTICSLAAAVIGLSRPVVGLLAVGMLCTLQPLMQTYLLTGGWWRWHTLDYWLLLVAILYAPLVLGQNDPRNRLVQLFALLLSLQILLSADWYRGLQDVAGVIALFGLVVYCVRVGRDRAAWCWLGLVCGTAGAVGGITFYVQGERLPAINPNAWAVFPWTALLTVCLAFPFARPWRRIQAILAMLAAANYALVFLSGSRGMLLTATGCALVLLALTRGIRGRWLAVLAAASVGLMITTHFSDLQGKAVNRIRLLLDSREGLVVRTSGRSQLLAESWAMFLERPFGVGTGGFAAERAATSEAAAWGPGRAVAAHAGWMKIMAENGLPGIGLMVSYLLSFVIAGWHSRNRDLLLLSLLVFVSFTLGFVSTEYQSKGLWLVAAAVMALLRPDSVPRLRHGAGRI